MALRTAHGNAKRHGAKTVIETLPIDELPAGVPGPKHVQQPARVAELTAQIATVEAALAALAPDAPASETTRLKGSLGGLRRALNAEQAKASEEELRRLSELATSLLPGMTVSDPDFQSGLPLAQDFIEREGKALAQDIGGGELPPGPGSMLVTSALQMLASRVEFARGRYREASLLGEQSSSALARAHEYAARRATLRGVSGTGSEPTPAEEARLVRSNIGPGFITLDDIDELKEACGYNSEPHPPRAPSAIVYSPPPRPPLPQDEPPARHVPEAEAEVAPSTASAELDRASAPASPATTKSTS